jgi:hypothetical protein
MKRIIFVLCILLLSQQSFSEDYASLVTGTDRRANPDLLALMTGHGLEPALAIAAALGRREDHYVADIIEYFLRHYHSVKLYESECIILTIVASLFPSDLPDIDFRERFTLNGAILHGLVADLETFESPDLRAACLRLAGRRNDPSYYPLLARTGEKMIRRLRSTGGRLTNVEYEEIFVFLEAVERISLKELKTPVAGIARYAADRRVVERARELLRALP